MKRLVILFVLVLHWVCVNAQVVYNHGYTVKGKTVSYHCVKQNELTITVRNTQNVDSLGKMYFDNGEVVPPDFSGSVYNFEFKEFVQVFKNALTSEELGQLKGKRGFFQVNVIADKAGNALELEFVFYTNDPVLSKFNPDRLFKLETKLKKLLKLKVSKRDREIKKIIYVVPLSYSKNL